MSETPTGERSEPPQEELPKLTQPEFRQYNRLAESMNQFVNILLHAL